MPPSSNTYTTTAHERNLQMNPSSQKPYTHEPYPSKRYHRDGTITEVASAEEHDALMASDPDNWAETPAAFTDPPASTDPAAKAKGKAKPKA